MAQHRVGATCTLWPWHLDITLQMFTRCPWHTWSYTVCLHAHARADHCSACHAVRGTQRLRTCKWGVAMQGTRLNQRQTVLRAMLRTPCRADARVEERRQRPC